MRPLQRMTGDGIRSRRGCTRMESSSSLNCSPAADTARSQDARASHAGGTKPIGDSPNTRSAARPRSIRSRAAGSSNVRNSASRAVFPHARQLSRHRRGSPSSSWRSPWRKISAPSAPRATIHSTNAGCRSSGHPPCQFGTTNSAGRTPRPRHKPHRAVTLAASAGVTSCMDTRR